MESSIRQLNPAFLEKLSGDDFVPIGRFEISGSGFNFHIEAVGAGSWLSSLYAWVSVKGGGTVLRIGKCEGPLITRISAYKRSLDDVMSDRLKPNEHFMGDTQPWERELWLEYAGYPGAGIIFAQSVPPETLSHLERELIYRYDPAGCGDSAAGRQRKRSWVAEHGPTFRVSKRERMSGFPQKGE